MAAKLTCAERRALPEKEELKGKFYFDVGPYAYCQPALEFIAQNMKDLAMIRATPDVTVDQTRRIYASAATHMVYSYVGSFFVDGRFIIIVSTTYTELGEVFRSLVDAVVAKLILYVPVKIDSQMTLNKIVGDIVDAKFAECFIRKSEEFSEDQITTYTSD